MQINFTGQTILITGAAQGLGGEMARRFAGAGGKVIATDIDGDGLQALAADAGPRLATQVLDVTDRHAVHAAVAAIGPVDVLVHCAGGVCGQVGRPVEEIQPDAWRRIFAVNTEGAFWCSQAVAPGMKAKGAGRIILISSGAGQGREVALAKRLSRLTGIRRDSRDRDEEGRSRGILVCGDLAIAWSRLHRRHRR